MVGTFRIIFIQAAFLALAFPARSTAPCLVRSHFSINICGMKEETCRRTQAVPLDKLIRGKCLISDGTQGYQAAPHHLRTCLHSGRDRCGQCSSPSYLASWEDYSGPPGCQPSLTMFCPESVLSTRNSGGNAVSYQLLLECPCRPPQHLLCAEAGKAHPASGDAPLTASLSPIS